MLTASVKLNAKTHCENQKSLLCDYPILLRICVDVSFKCGKERECVILVFYGPTNCGNFFETNQCTSIEYHTMNVRFLLLSGRSA